MKAGDLVVCNCPGEIWYKGLPGILLGFNKFGKLLNKRPVKGMADALVFFENGQIVELIPSGLEIYNEV